MFFALVMYLLEFEDALDSFSGELFSEQLELVDGNVY
jgi:hypothetical protein